MFICKTQPCDVAYVGCNKNSHTSVGRRHCNCKLLYYHCSEFCGHDNQKVDNMVGQLPTSEAVEYVLDLPPSAEEEGSTLDDADAKKPKASSSVAKGGTIWFAIDISSSMACTIDIPDLQGNRGLLHHSVNLLRNTLSYARYYYSSECEIMYVSVR